MGGQSLRASVIAKLAQRGASPPLGISPPKTKTNDASLRELNIGRGTARFARRRARVPTAGAREPCIQAFGAGTCQGRSRFAVAQRALTCDTVHPYGTVPDFRREPCPPGEGSYNRTTALSWSDRDRTVVRISRRSVKTSWSRNPTIGEYNAIYVPRPARRRLWLSIAVSTR